MFKIKKAMASLLAIVTMTVGIGSMGVNAAGDATTWGLYYTPHAEHSVEIYSVNTYGPGYKATCTSKSGNGALNYVVITSADSRFPLDKTVKISEINTTVYFKTVPTFSGEMASFKVELMCTGGNYNSSNYGTLAIRNYTG